MRKAGFPLRIAVAALLLGSCAIAASRCGGEGRKAGTTPSPIGSPTAAPRTPNPTPTLYAWADPIAGGGQMRLADHTWVTTFDAPSACPPPADYWYSWGGCHSTGPLASAQPLAHGPADLGVALCICQPDVEDYRFVPDDPAHGGIDFYGISGVCHQLSNRILFASAGPGREPLTVENAHGYFVSRFLFGTYGTNVSEWAARKARCLAPPPTAAAAPGTPVAMAMAVAPAQTLDADLAAMLRERLGPDVSRSKVEAIRSLRASLQTRKALLDRELLSGRRAPRDFAVEVNALLNQTLQQAAQILGPSDYRKLFAISPEERIGVVDPAVAERSSYGGRG